ILNAAARRWGWGAAELAVLARELGALGFLLHQPALEGIARWCARGLTAYDACYLALASERRTVVVTADSLMLSVGGANVRSIEGAAGG
ncbi:MAG: hypothetical protein M3442_05250, partial [Chloroflexota bacterium]|nr:hypothetical protein [Chloroflexota bacterium]